MNFGCRNRNRTGKLNKIAGLGANVKMNWRDFPERLAVVRVDSTTDGHYLRIKAAKITTHELLIQEC